MQNWTAKKVYFYAVSLVLLLLILFNVGSLLWQLIQITILPPLPSGTWNYEDAKRQLLWEKYGTTENVTVTPEQLFISDLFDRIVDEGITQVIIATSFTMEGDITADYLTKQLKTLQPNIPIYRLGTGLPVGGELNHADKATLRSAFITIQKVGEENDYKINHGQFG